MSLQPDNLVTPACEHFGKCGGCSLQNLSATDYKDFKQSILVRLVDEIGADSSVIEPMIEIGAHSRRRAEFKLVVKKREVEIGFYASKSHDIVQLNECPVSDNQLIEILPALKACLQSMKKPSIVKSISLTVLDGGLDCSLTISSPFKQADKDKLISFAKEHNVIRLSDGEHSFYDSGEASISFADISVNLPIGAFLQATVKGQRAITDIVTKHLSECNNIADLYSGCGTYSFPLLATAKHISAFEGDGEMVAAMHNAVLKNNLEGRVLASARDLYTRPLKDYELNRYDGIVINPPRNGALPQIKYIAKSDVAKLVMVSCNPSTFKRDAKELLNNGYEMTSATAIDQFYWTNHLEIVAVFSRR